MYFSFTFSVNKPRTPLYFSNDSRLYDGSLIKNTFNDWHLIPVERPCISTPKPKTKIIEVPGMNGDLDLSESLTGAPVFKNRAGSVTYKVVYNNDLPNNGLSTFYKDTVMPISPKERWMEIYRDISAFLHGKRMYMAYEEDPAYFYYGRFNISMSPQNDFSEITIDYDMEPYKYDYSESALYFDTMNFDSDNRVGVKYDGSFKDVVVDTSTYISLARNADWGNFTQNIVVPKFIVKRHPDYPTMQIDIRFSNPELGINNVEISRQSLDTPVDYEFSFSDPRIMFSQNKNYGILIRKRVTGNTIMDTPIKYSDFGYDNGMSLEVKGSCILSIEADTGRL